MLYFRCKKKRYKDMKNIPKIRKKSKSKRSRCRGRTAETFNNKLAKLQVQYKHLFKTSQASKSLYLALPEKDKKPQNKVFFCDKYSSFDKFLAVNELRPAGKAEPKVKKTVSKPTKVKIWGR